MQVTMLKSRLIGVTTYQEGQDCDLPSDVAQELIQEGHARRRLKRAVKNLDSRRKAVRGVDDV